MSDDVHPAPAASTGQQPDGGLTHVRPDGSAHMVDVTGKPETRREAAAQAVLTTRADVVARLVDGTLPKGEALGTARVAGIMAAKQTPALIPLCHPLPLGAITVDFEADESSVTVVARVRTRGVTGVEMEALTAATVAALTLFDMVKAVDHLAVIGDVKVLEKSGGKSGDWSR
ncbi:cyclic pyranopterin monophosphate synthase MoaC [Frigoribacterium faeni]|uniref:cyclic pyranopterin monophosphate synthase MoaC n=1 Tax=Frigoribacterium faeni TaxID=145483 RepID=UPI00141B5B9F|nr:cyclic pyranopterin monophosphate synthase MoaC [Frigoribacterium faeni]NIJ05897.1 cyclic pyranopterin phosphate synthase [Frigoribacterium faeni]